MFAKLTTSQRIQIGLVLAMAFLLVLGSNRLDQRHFSTIQTTVNSVYKDRVVVQDFIYQLTNIFHKKEPRTLTAAFKFYCDRNLENAHTAEADTEATYEILKAQLDRYPDLEKSINFLSEYSNRFNAADFAGVIFIDKDSGKEMFSFGKYKNQSVENVLDKDPGYYGWIQKSEFPLYTKKVLTAIKLRKLSS
mgnify:CR=1 FL=1